MIPAKQPILVFELGHLQVFCYQTVQEWQAGIYPAEFFWQKKGEPRSYGPFVNIYLAVTDYTAQLASKKEETKTDNVIHVDFKAKRRI